MSAKQRANDPVLSRKRLKLEVLVLALLNTSPGDTVEGLDNALRVPTEATVRHLVRKGQLTETGDRLFVTEFGLSRVRGRPQERTA